MRDEVQLPVGLEPRHRLDRAPASVPRRYELPIFPNPRLPVEAGVGLAVFDVVDDTDIVEMGGFGLAINRGPVDQVILSVPADHPHWNTRPHVSGNDGAVFAAVEVYPDFPG